MSRPASRLAVPTALALFAALAAAAQASPPVLGPRIDLPVRAHPRAVAVGDLDGDHHADLAVACESDSFVTIFYGLGGGSFEPPVDLAVGPAPSCIAIADFNRDGHADIIVGIGSANPRLRLMSGIGGRAFVAGGDSPLASPGRDLKFADFDGDGRIDVAGVESVAPSDGFIVPGTVPGYFGSRTTLPGNAGKTRAWLAILPYDANASPDVYIPTIGSDATFYVQNGGGGFDGLTAPPSAAGAAPLDFDQDGRVDLLTGGDPFTPGAYRLDFYRNLGNGFAFDHAFEVTGPLGAIETADLDGNGMPDAVIERPAANAVDVALIACSGGSVLEKQTFDTGANPTGLTIADANDDGFPDVLVANYNGASITLRAGLQPGPLACTPIASVNTPSVDLGTAAQFQPSNWSLAVLNTGTGLLHLGAPQIDNPEFVIDPPLPTGAIPVGQQAVFYLRYRRATVGTANGTFTIATDDPDHPLLTVPLTGVAIAPAQIGFDASALLPPPEVAFGDTTSRSIVVSNGGAVSLSVIASVKGVEDLSALARSPGDVTSSTTTALPVDRFDGGGFLWDLQPDGSIATGTNGAFAGGLDLLGYPPHNQATLEDANRTFDLGVSSVPGGALVRRKVYVSPSASFTRWFELVANPGGSTLPYTVDVLTNFGGPATEPIASSNGDALFTPADTWAVFSDGDATPRPAIAQVVGGTQRPSAITVGSNGQFTRLRWGLSLPPGTVTAVVHWAVQSATRAGAIALAQQLALGQQGAYDGLDSGELALLGAIQPLAAFEPIPEAFSLAPGASRTLKIRYRGVAGFDLPADVGATLQLASNDPFHPDTTALLAMHILADTASTVDVPGAGAARLAFGALAPNPVPAGAAAVLNYSLASDASARIEAYDVRGRRLFARAIEHPVPGPGSVELAPMGNAGLVWFRLVQGGREIRKRGVFLH